jgi:hypothetical protein
MFGVNQGRGQQATDEGYVADVKQPTSLGKGNEYWANIE